MVTAHILGEVCLWVLNNVRAHCILGELYYTQENIIQLCSKFNLALGTVAWENWLDKFVLVIVSGMIFSLVRFCKHHLLILNTNKRHMRWVSKQILIGSKCVYYTCTHMFEIHSLEWHNIPRYCYEKNNVTVLRKKSQHTWWVSHNTSIV